MALLCTILPKPRGSRTCPAAWKLLFGTVSLSQRLQHNLGHELVAGRVEVNAIGGQDALGWSSGLLVLRCSTNALRRSHSGTFSSLATARLTSAYSSSLASS